MSTGQVTRQRSSSSGTRPVIRSTTPVIDLPPNTSLDIDFQPCAATASIFLFAQGKSILCLHHDTLAIERRFERHKEAVVMLSVDNVSERGAGRLVVSYDIGQTAIVWDLFTGDEIARFASYENIKVAAWMKNGHVAFGNTQGNVIIFEPSTSEHRSARTIFDPITALAPASDCQTYAIGYQNGTILLGALQPSFTVLHTLSVSRAPSPIVGLAWHTSSTKQKSDMLATQSADGDLRVWSVGKPPSIESPKVIRVLKRGDNVEAGLNWIAWSKNGRIVQFSQGETWAWDVRTKHVAYEPIPTIEGVTALANYGPTAALFTLGPNNTVQQYDLNPPALVKNVRYDPNFTPTKQNYSAQSTPKTNQHNIIGAAPPVPMGQVNQHEAGRGNATLSTIQRAANEMNAIEHARQLRAEMGSPLSTVSRTESISSRSSTGQYGYRGAPSVSSRAASGTTFSTFSPSMAARESSVSGMGSGFFPPTASIASSSRRSRGSRLRQEVIMSPEKQLVDLFPCTRARLAALPYAPQPQPVDQTNMTPSELRRQMLEVVFGWDGDIEPMIRDELNRHPPNSMSATLLSKWLGEVNVDNMAAAITSNTISSTDWMLLALSQMNGQASASKQLGHAFTQRLLQQGDIHTAATILLGMGDREDAIEIYVSRNYYMEGILLTSLLFPEEWERQSHLVRRWGEYVVENSQQHLAIRCFSCTGVDTSLPWASPTQSPFVGSQQQSSMPHIISPPTSPPLQSKAGASSLARLTAKNASLKLITSFGGDSRQMRFPGLKTDDRTPTNAPGVTPIAESALSPGGTPSTYLRPQLHSGSRNNLSVRTPGGYRDRLPSIGETPIDSVPPPLTSAALRSLARSSESESERGNSNGSDIRLQQALAPSQNVDDAPLTLSSARYDPSGGDMTPLDTPQTAAPNTAIKTIATDRFAAMKERSRTRNGSRDRKPDGLHIHMPSLDQLNLNAYASSESGQSARGSEHRRSNTWSALQSGTSTQSRSDRKHDLMSPPGTEQSWTSSVKSPSVSGRSMDQYISSLEEAQFRAKQKESRRAHRSREGRSNATGSSEHKSRSKHRHRDVSEERGRGVQKYIRPAKRSPSSPVPMSPEDLQKYRDANSQSIGSTLDLNRDSSPEAPASHSRGYSSQRRKGVSKNRSHSKTSDLSHRTVMRVGSPNGGADSQFGSEAHYDTTPRKSSRRPSPSGLLSPSSRGRSKSQHVGSSLRSPSSPLPMSPQARLYQRSDEDEPGPSRIVEANQRRLRSAHRSTSRRPHERGSSSRRDLSPDRHHVPDERQKYQDRRSDYPQHDSSTDQKTSDRDSAPSDGNNTLRRNKSHRTLKKEMAARELEARRESLTARAMTAVLPPSSLSRPTLPARSQTDLSNSPTSSSWSRVGSPNQHYGSMSDDSTGPLGSPDSRAASVGPYGLPATPRAMRRPKQKSVEEIPAVPELPDSFYYTGQPMRELPRSMSAPIPEPDIQTPSDMPKHPAFHRGLRPSTKQRPQFLPLGDIGKQRPSQSMDIQNMQPLNVSPGIHSIDEALDEGDSTQVINVSDLPQQPPILPELQHLAAAPLPPPPPPPPPPFRNSDIAHHSISSGSGVGTINIVMDDPSPKGTPVIDASNGVLVHDVPVQQVPETLSPSTYAISPPLRGATTSPSSGHRRGRSIDQFGTKFKGIAERMRSTSRSRTNLKVGPQTPAAMPAPYESIPQYF